MASTTTFGELIPVGGGDPIPLQKSQLLIGRRSRCDIVLKFPNVSAQHCQLSLINGYWEVRDLNSRNGIKVNGDRCESHFLQPGDELSIAKHTYTIQYEPHADAPPMEEEDIFERSLLEKAGLMRRQASTPRPRSARPIDPTDETDFGDDENQALRWMDDDE